MQTLDELQKAIGVWADETFPKRSGTYDGLFKHIRKEVNELEESHHPYEAADVIILLCHFANREGFSLFDEIQKKFEIVKKREWAEPDTDGIHRHIGEDDG